jgi:hypothetical protein
MAIFSVRNMGTCGPDMDGTYHLLAVYRRNSIAEQEQETMGYQGSLQASL